MEQLDGGLSLAKVNLTMLRVGKQLKFTLGQAHACKALCLTLPGLIRILEYSDRSLSLLLAFQRTDSRKP